MGRARTFVWRSDCHQSIMVAKRRRLVVSPGVRDRASGDPYEIQSECPSLRMPRSEPLEHWDLAIPPIPKRSHLYSLEPMNVGTAFVESLTGYVTRLAEAHSGSVADLVSIELSAPASVTPLIAPYSDRNRSNLFYCQSHAINGIGEAPKRWVNVLEGATLRQGFTYPPQRPAALGVWKLPTADRHPSSDVLQPARSSDGSSRQH